MNRLPREVVDASSQETFKAGLDGALNNLDLAEVVPAFWRGVGLKDPSNPNYFMFSLARV